MPTREKRETILGYGKIIRRIMEYGVLAPSVYNSQPWLFQPDEGRGSLDLYADLRRARPVGVDPRFRDLYLALGACTEFMAVAASGLGWAAKVIAFPEDEGMDKPAARLVFKPQDDMEPEEIFSALLTRQTHGGPYQNDPVGDVQRERLRRVVPPTDRERLEFLTGEKERRHFHACLQTLGQKALGREDLTQEAKGWARKDLNAVDGIPFSCVGLNPGPFFSFLPGWKREAARRMLIQAQEGTDPAYLWMTTSQPGPEAYFRSGRWQARLRLTLTVLELGCEGLNLPVTLAESQPDLLKPLNVSKGEQLLWLARVGSPLQKQWPRTLRREPGQCLLTSN
jgi:hypothetical protein